MNTSRMNSPEREAKHSDRNRRTSSPSVVRTLNLGAERVQNLENVEITPIKMDMEIKNAVQRQRRTLGIKYAPPIPMTILPRPKFHDVVPGAFPPSFPQRTIVNTPSSMTGAPGGVESSFRFAQITNGGGVRDDVTVERLQSDGRGASTLRLGGHRRNVSTISYSPNELHPGMPDQTNSPRNMGVSGANAINARDLRLNGFQSQGQIMNSSFNVENSSLSKTLPPGFKLKDTPTTGFNHPFGFSRSLTSDRLTRRKQESSTRQLPYNDDMGLNGERNTTDGSVFLPPGHRGNPWANAASSRWSDKTFESSKGGYIRTVSNPPIDSFQVFAENTPASHELLKAKHDAQSSAISNLAGLSSMELADSIIKAVSENIDDVYHLCQTKVKYSDFIEKNQPHRLFGSEAFWDDSRYTKKENATSPRTIAAPNSNATFLKRTKILPSLVSNPHDSISSIPHSPRDTDSRFAKVKLVPNQPLPEPEIDYDKPITIIIDSNQDNCHKATRPILKLASRSNLSSRTFEKTRGGDLNNNTLSESRVLTSDGSQLAGDIFRTQGRLVRFNFDTTIHEFTPSEPVLSPK